jgi:hypothetical protein
VLPSSAWFFTVADEGLMLGAEGMSWDQLSSFLSRYSRVSGETEQTIVGRRERSGWRQFQQETASRASVTAVKIVSTSSPLASNYAELDGILVGKVIERSSRNSICTEKKLGQPTWRSVLNLSEAKL